MGHERSRRRAVYEEWLILGIFGTLTAVFAWYTMDGQEYDLVFISPLVMFIAVMCAIVAFGLGRWPAPAAPDSEGEAGGRSQSRGAFALLMLLLLLGLGTVGFFTSLFLFLIGAMWVLGVRRWTTLVVVPVSMIAVIYVAFVKLLGVPAVVSPIGLY